MKRVAAVRSSLEMQPEDARVRWRRLKQRVQRYLEREGVPVMQAERFSHEIIVMCAQEAEAASVDAMGERALDEAQTILEGWQASRRAALLDAA
jgi:hypothetical protein